MCVYVLVYSNDFVTNIYTMFCSVRHRPIVVVGTFMYLENIIVISTFMLYTWKPVALPAGSSLHETERYLALVYAETPALKTNCINKRLR